MLGLAIGMAEFLWLDSYGVPFLMIALIALLTGCLLYAGNLAGVED